MVEEENLESPKEVVVLENEPKKGQGLGGALARVGTEYYMKDVQKVQPSEAQVYAGITSIPWIVKPLWGLLTDVLPIFGCCRRPYFMVAVYAEEGVDDEEPLTPL
ncbi:hypothetical protein ACOSQ2_032917 [Xanthoceras sorbifolium]